jgi:hypothetical protein
MQENELQVLDDNGVDIENMIQITPVTSIKKQRKRKSVENSQEEDELNETKEFEKNGVFYYEKPKKLFNEKTNKKIFIGISSKEKHQLNELIKSNFFTPEKLKIVVDLNNEKSNMPRLRAYDWAVTNFAKTRNVSELKDKETSLLFDPYTLYVGELKKFHRLLFDPFRRGTHVFFHYEEKMEITTTGQLTFIKWCLENNIDLYVQNNLNEIKINMNLMNKNRKKEKALFHENKKKHFSIEKKILKTGFYHELEL